jgi:subtilase family serine protease
MRKLAQPRVVIGAVSVLLIATIAVVGMLHYSQVKAAAPFNAHPISANPVKQAAGHPTGHVFGCQTQLNPAAIVCYSPEQIRTAYHINSLLNAGIDGTGHTIVIIDAFQNPFMQDDLAAFDGVFGLPAPTFEQVAPDGLTPFDFNDPNQAGWAGEITLDVQWSHAIAPGAKIELVLAKSNQDADLLSVTKYAVDHNLGDIISQSFGENETCVDPNLLAAQHAVFQEATDKHISIFASSGDQGAAQQTCDGSSWTQVASSPASDPLVTAVGATELLASPACRNAQLNEIACASGVPAGTYQSESALNEPAGEFTNGNFSTGGGFSKIYGKPKYQNHITNSTSGRGVPDVSYNGAIGHGVLAAFELGGGPGAFFIFGGTSAGSPQWAGITALADQKAGRNLGFLNDALYKVAHQGPHYGANFFDVTTGNNTVQEPDATNTFVTVPGFNAGTNWDATTGLGSPIVDQLVNELIQFA